MRYFAAGRSERAKATHTVLRVPRISPQAIRFCELFFAMVSKESEPPSGVERTSCGELRYRWGDLDHVALVPIPFRWRAGVPRELDGYAAASARIAELAR